ncbi:MAG: HlyD family efflux transporter periplasmic adaptor subunit [Cyanobacteria bacterium]|nr:HlyD family efflux transporter periplasmic adaptor subunit [Cyanobacteriota bacterium]
MAVWPYRVVVRASGTARPGGETSLVHASREGRVTEIRIQPNQVVEQGQLIAVLDPADLEGRELKLQQDRSALERQLESQRKEDRAALQGAQLEVEKTMATLDLANSEYQRYSQLVESGAASREQMEEKAASLSVARSNLAKTRREVTQQQSRGESAQARLAQQLVENRADRAQLARDLGRTLVRAPVSGIVFSVALRNPLQVVAAGQELARIAPRGTELLVKVLVLSEDIANVEAGQRADLRLAGCPYPDFGTLRARVISVAPDALASGAAPDPGSTLPATGPGNAGEGSSSYVVTLRPEHTQLRSSSRSCALRVGMDLTADIVTRVETVLQFLLRRTRLLLGV